MCEKNKENVSARIRTYDNQALFQIQLVQIDSTSGAAPVAGAGISTQRYWILAHPHPNWHQQNCPGQWHTDYPDGGMP